MQGFSLLELLIVIAIIAILSAIALPSYRLYTEKARFSELIVATEPYKIAISLALHEGEQQEHLMTGQNGIPEAPESTANLASLNVDQGVITVTATPAAGAYTYILTPNEDGSKWTVSGSCLDKQVCHS